MIERFMLADGWDAKNKRIIVSEPDRFLTIPQTPDAYATVGEVKDGTIAGWLVSGSALLTVSDEQGREAVVLIERDKDAPFYPNLWYMPAGRAAPNENPGDTARREALEEVVFPPDIDPMQIDKDPKGLQNFEIMTGSEIHKFQAHAFLLDEEGQTLEFVSRFRMKVPDLDKLTFADGEGFGRTVRAIEAPEFQSLAKADKITIATSWAAQQKGLMPKGFGPQTTHAPRPRTKLEMKRI